MQPAGPFVINLQNLEQGESHVEMIGSGADLDLGPEGDRLAGPVVVRAAVFRSGQKIEVQGMLLADLQMECDRCLESVPVSLRLPLRVFAERQDSRDRRSRQEVREDDLGIVYHDGQFVVLTEEVRQALLVEVPWHVLCKADCQGLCPRCGTNRNVESCSCLEREAGSEKRQ
jgi:uncharacterized protein